MAQPRYVVSNLDRPQVPSNRELYEIFNRFLMDWAGVRSRLVAWIGTLKAPLPDERELMFAQPFLGILIVRTTGDASMFLHRCVTGKKLGPYDGILEELLVLFWRRFTAEYWNLEAGKAKAALFRRSTPEDWPDRKPDAACKVFIVDQPLELRLWMPVTDDELI